ncbi:hypothetical protein F7Q99_23950 [Streptomyces kaniharaensis]|uniref:Uncharacterized protein n=1 Tax=Streptomyces kaniharaensis TaxID=212423 RepID=A0A6N7KY09_9ACTN|nr:hypothetical protein [Streptomyces kaniharaensis]MQS15237.1 hypothetical protein [Streptomyces kaniharaensis]
MNGKPGIRWQLVGLGLAVMALAGGAAGSWQLFHRDAPCWGKEPGWPAPALGAIGLAVLGAIAAALSWVAGWWRHSRTAGVAAWGLAAVAVLCAIGMVLLGRSSHCD